MLNQDPQEEGTPSAYGSDKDQLPIIRKKTNLYHCSAGHGSLEKTAHDRILTMARERTTHHLLQLRSIGMVHKGTACSEGCKSF